MDAAHKAAAEAAEAAAAAAKELAAKELEECETHAAALAAGSPERAAADAECGTKATSLKAAAATLAKAEAANGADGAGDSSGGGSSGDDADLDTKGAAEAGGGHVVVEFTGLTLEEMHHGNWAIHQAFSRGVARALSSLDGAATVEPERVVFGDIAGTKVRVYHHVYIPFIHPVYTFTITIYTPMYT
jgi:hypothetical protein